MPDMPAPMTITSYSAAMLVSLPSLMRHPVTPRVHQSIHHPPQHGFGLPIGRIADVLEDDRPRDAVDDWQRSRCAVRVERALPPAARPPPATGARGPASAPRACAARTRRSVNRSDQAARAVAAWRPH